MEKAQIVAPNFCLLIDELLAAWRVQGNDVPVKDRRIAARAALEQAIAQLSAPALAKQENYDASKCLLCGNSASQHTGHECPAPSKILKAAAADLLAGFDTPAPSALQDIRTMASEIICRDPRSWSEDGFRIIDLTATLSWINDRARDAHAAVVREAVAYHEGKWPVSLYSGVMFFLGETVRQEEFEAMRAKLYGA